MILQLTTQRPRSLADQLLSADERRRSLAVAGNAAPVAPAITPETIVESARVAENRRIMGILNCPAAKGREQQALALAVSSDLSADQAAVTLAAAPSDEALLAASIVSLVQPTRPASASLAREETTWNM